MLQVLNLKVCANLQNLPNSIGELGALHTLILLGCRRLEALPNSITELTGLQMLYISGCSSISNQLTIFGLPTGLIHLEMDFATQLLALAIGQYNALESLPFGMKTTDESISVLDTLGILRFLSFTLAIACPLPCSQHPLTSLHDLVPWRCFKLQKLPKSIGQLHELKELWLIKCRSLETLPDSLSGLTSLQCLGIGKCTSFTKLPASIGHLSSLQRLRIQGCSKLEPLPDSMMQLKALEFNNTGLWQLGRFGCV